MTQAPRPLLQAVDLSISVGDRPLLTGVSFDVSPGDHVAVTGPSGSGKSTLLRALARLHPVAAGRVLTGGTEAFGVDVPGQRQAFQYVPQRARLFGKVASEAIRWPFSFAATTIDAPSDDEILRTFTALKLRREILGQRDADLSEGERQRVALARALLLQPTVLLLDEPTSALDKASRSAAEAAILAFIDASPTTRAAVWVSHDEQQLRRVSNREIPLESFLASSISETTAASDRSPDDVHEAAV